MCAKLDRNEKNNFVALNESYTTCVRVCVYPTTNANKLNRVKSAKKFDQNGEFIMNKF